MKEKLELGISGGKKPLSFKTRSGVACSATGAPNPTAPTPPTGLVSYRVRPAGRTDTNQRKILTTPSNFNEIRCERNIGRKPVNFKILALWVKYSCNCGHLKNAHFVWKCLLYLKATAQQGYEIPT